MDKLGQAENVEKTVTHNRYSLAYLGPISEKTKKSLLDYYRPEISRPDETLKIQWIHNFCAYRFWKGQEWLCHVESSEETAVLAQ